MLKWRCPVINLEHGKFQGEQLVGFNSLLSVGYYGILGYLSHIPGPENPIAGGYHDNDPMWTNILFLLGRLFFRIFLSFRKGTHNEVVFLSSGATRRLKRLRCECLLASSRMVRRPPSSARMEGAISQHWGRLWGLREKPWSFWKVRIHDYPVIYG